MTEMESYHTAISALPAFLRGEWTDMDSDVLGELCETAAYDFALGHPSKKYASVRHIALSPVWNADRLTDAVMLFAYPSEPLDLSVSRLATAARYLGFTELSPYAVAVCYFKFNSLSKEYTKCKHK